MSSLIMTGLWVQVAQCAQVVLGICAIIAIIALPILVFFWILDRLLW